MISIVSPLYNKEDQVELFLASVFRQTHKKAFEIILVDDLSTDQTMPAVFRMLDKKPPHISVRTLSNESNQGNCTSRNRGILAASGDIIMVTDADCLLSENFIDEYLRTYEETGADIVISNFGIELGKRDPSSTLAEYEAKPEKVRADKKVQDPQSPASFLNTVTRGFSFRKASFEPPVYDEAFNYRNSHDSGFGWEDIDVGCRAHEGGCDIAYAEKAFTIHVTHPPNTDAVTKPLKLLRNYRLLHQKHPWLRDAKNEWSLGTYRKITMHQMRSGLARNDDNRLLEKHLGIRNMRNNPLTNAVVRALRALRGAVTRQRPIR